MQTSNSVASESHPVSFVSDPVFVDVSDFVCDASISPCGSHGFFLSMASGGWLFPLDSGQPVVSPLCPFGRPSRGEGCWSPALSTDLLTADRGAVATAATFVDARAIAVGSDSGNVVVADSEAGTASNAAAVPSEVLRLRPGARESGVTGGATFAALCDSALWLLDPRSGAGTRAAVSGFGLPAGSVDATVLDSHTLGVGHVHGGVFILDLRCATSSSSSRVVQQQGVAARGVVAVHRLPDQLCSITGHPGHRGLLACGTLGGRVMTLRWTNATDVRKACYAVPGERQPVTQLAPSAGSHILAGTADGVVAHMPTQPLDTHVDYFTTRRFMPTALACNGTHFIAAFTIQGGHIGGDDQQQGAPFGSISKVVAATL